MIVTNYGGVKTYHGPLSHRPQANKVLIGTMFVVPDTHEMFICTQVNSERKWMPMSGGSGVVRRRMICENCGGPHEHHETKCSWCKEVLVHQ